MRRSTDLARVDDEVTSLAVALDHPEPAARIRAAAPDGVDRVIEVALSANADLDAQVVAEQAVIAAYSSPQERPQIPFRPLLFANVTLRLLGSDDFPPAAKQQAARDLTRSAAEGALRVPLAATYPLEIIAAAHLAVQAGERAGRVQLLLPAGAQAARHP